VYVYFVRFIFLIGCAGSVGISLASRVVYISRVRISPLCGVAGRYNLFGYFGGVGGGTVRIFFSLWLCSGGYGTAELARGVVRFSLLSSVCCLFSWRLDICGRNLLCYIL
jgi:hypothetical protein